MADEKLDVLRIHVWDKDLLTKVPRPAAPYTHTHAEATAPSISSQSATLARVG